MDDTLTNDNFLIYCAKHYDTAQCHSTEEFFEDLRRIKYIKKLITRYIENDDLKERLILNHIIVLNNLFGPVPTTRILFLKLYKQMGYIKPFLVLLNILPDIIYNVNNRNYYTNEIVMDQRIVEALRKL